MPSTHGTGPKASVPSSPDPDATVVMPVVPLHESPLKGPRGLTEEETEHLAATAKCQHIAYEVLGTSSYDDHYMERRKCADCGVRWSARVDPAAEEDTPKPPKQVYGHAQVVSYLAGGEQFDVLIPEMAIISAQAGVLVLQHPGTPVYGIVGVRPFLKEEPGEPAPAHQH